MKSRARLLGLLGALIAAAVAIVLVIVRPWTSGDDGAQTFALDRGVQVTVTPPTGWQAAAARAAAAGQTLTVVPDGETRTTYDALNEAVKRSSTDPAVPPVHAVFATVGDCGALNLPAGTLPAGQWQHGKPTTSTSDGVSNAVYRAVQRVDEHSCLLLVGLDSQHGDTLPAHRGVDLAQQLVAERQISGSVAR